MCTHKCCNLHCYLTFFVEKGGKTCWSVSWLQVRFISVTSNHCLSQINLNLIAALVLLEGSYCTYKHMNTNNYTACFQSVGIAQYTAMDVSGQHKYCLVYARLHLLWSSARQFFPAPE